MKSLSLKWSKDATDSLNDIMEYLFAEFGISSVIKLRDEIDNYANTLLTNPKMGIIEPILLHKKYEYRSIVVNSVNKIVYRIDSNTLYIVDIWDMRRSPENLSNRIS